MDKEQNNKINFSFDKIKKNSGALFLVMAGVLFFILIIRFIIINTSNTDTVDNNSVTVYEKEEIIPEIKKTPRYLDGVMVNEENDNSYLFAAMIENHFESRPQSGLEEALLVFEVPVEGGITRFLAFFDQSLDIKEIGPIRSARPYFLDWTKEFDALYLHVGGSKDALESIPKLGIEDLDQFYLYKYYWRDSERLAPHNVYTSTDLLQRALRDRELTEKKGEYESWLFKDELELAYRGDDAKNITVNFSKPIYNVTWKYNKEKNSYLRYYDNEPHQMKNGKILDSKNVVIMFTDIDVIDDYGRKFIKTVGTGKAMIYQDGKMFGNVTWRKDKRKSRLVFYNNDKEFEFNRGKTWIEVVENGTSINY